MPTTNSEYRYLSFTDNSPYRRYVQVKSPMESKPTIDKPAATVAPTHGSYGPLLFDPRWKAKRREILSRDGNKCIHCKRDKDLQVHHRQYHFVTKEKKFRLPWDYPDHLMITLCESCHTRGHRKYKVPAINI